MVHILFRLFVTLEVRRVPRSGAVSNGELPCRKVCIRQIGQQIIMDGYEVRCIVSLRGYNSSAIVMSPAPPE
ncbi:hypothetical protein E2C01_013503 [Portunus trituberculatus]|uniref:Uncharacterized protein n=1 Tax=Portunus trituberculatus TaxID=210409 RepID=A0A5B7DH79_PORTR|nr:hypothetical protein [Portunus trituberculatus]